MRRTGQTCNIARESGWTLSELVFVVLILGILLIIVIPVMVSVSAHAAQKVCYANQRQLEGIITVWANEPGHEDSSTIAGVVDSTHPFVTGEYVLHVPRCPSAPQPTDPANPTAGEGAYSLSATSSVLACPWGDLGPHGSYPH